MINIVCSLLDHKQRIKSQMLCCSICKSNANPYFQFPFDQQQKNIIQSLLNLSNFSEKLIQNDYERMDCLQKWNELMQKIIEQNCIIVENQNLRFSEDNLIALQKIETIIRKFEVQLAQTISIYQQQKQLIFEGVPFNFEGHHKDPIENVTLSYDGELIAITSLKNIKIWKIQSKKLLQSFRHNYINYYIVNNQLLAYMGDTDSSIYLRNIFSQKQKEDVKQLKIDNNHGISLIFDQDSKFLIRYNSKMINVYNIHLNVLIYTFTSQFFIVDIDLSTDNKLLSSISIQGYIQIWSFKSRRRVVQQMVQKNASGLKFSKKSEMILTVGAGIDHGAIKVWKIVGMRNQLMKIFQIKMEGTQNLIGCFFSDTFILTKYKNSREIKFNNISSRKIEETLEFSEGSEVNAKIITSSDNNLIVYSASWWLSMWKAQYA